MKINEAIEVLNGVHGLKAHVGDPPQDDIAWQTIKDCMRKYVDDLFYYTACPSYGRELKDILKLLDSPSCKMIDIAEQALQEQQKQNIPWGPDLSISTEYPE